MEQELLNTFDKELLLKDLCARLPYDTVCQVEFKSDGKYESKNMILSGIFKDEAYFTIENGSVYSNDYKPYLFPLSSMTEEHKEEYVELQQRIIYNGQSVVNLDVMKYVDWCYEHHIDINSLIPMGLAIDATGLNIY